MKIAQLVTWMFHLFLRLIDKDGNVYERVGIPSKWQDSIEGDPFIGVEEATFTMA